MAERVRLNRSLLSSSYTPSAATEVGILEQQAVGQSQITKLLNTMSGFFYDQMAEKVVEEGELLGARNPITIDEIKKAQQTGENVVGRLGYGMKGKAARSTAFKILQNEIEVEARREYQNVMTKALEQNLPHEEVADSLDAITIGYTKLLDDVDPRISYNTKANLSVITNDFYTKYLNDQLEKENSKTALREIIALQEDIEIIQPTLKQILKKGKPQDVIKYAKEYQKIFKDVILNSNMSDSKKLKSIEDAELRIDDSIVETLIEVAQEKNRSLSDILLEIDSPTITRQGLSYQVKDPDLSALLNSLSPKGQSNIVDSISSRLDEQNAKISIQTQQDQERSDLLVSEIEQRLKTFFKDNDETTVPPSIRNLINELNFRDNTKYKLYSETLQNVTAGFAAEINTDLENRITNQLETLESMEITDLLKFKSELTREKFNEFKEIIRKQQNVEVKNFLKDVTSNPVYKNTVPEFQTNYLDELVFEDNAKALKAKQKFIRDQLELQADNAFKRGEAFDAFEAYKELKRDPANQIFFNDPLAVEETVIKESSTVFKRIQNDFGFLSGTGLLDDIEQFDDTIEFYEALEKNLRNKSGKIRREYRANQLKSEDEFILLKTDILTRLKELKNKK
tara:strand:- start:111 stop:1988 length:1878 start_codon:yes stop_codon:yes gene_type:complete